jgi:cation diffusion facilitator CzcD-associated flavoprotein CzcO
MGCKRILISDDYYPALMRDNVTVAAGLDSVTSTGVVDTEGVERDVDVIVWATGFNVLEPPLADRIIGRDGGTLAEAFARNGMSAYKGTTVAGFPNLYMLQGPNTGLGHSSVVLMSEAQIDYLVPAVASGLVHEVDPARQRAYVAEVDRRLSTTVWQQGGCRSWYQNGHGRNVALWPGSTHGFARMMRSFDPGAYRIRRRKGEHRVASA